MPVPRQYRHGRDAREPHYCTLNGDTFTQPARTKVAPRSAVQLPCVSARLYAARRAFARPPPPVGELCERALRTLLVLHTDGGDAARWVRPLLPEPLLHVGRPQELEELLKGQRLRLAVVHLGLHWI